MKLPIKALRDWEGYSTPDPDDPSEIAGMMARPFTRIEDADGKTVVTAHDLFTFRPGDAERIVACVNACDEMRPLLNKFWEQSDHDFSDRDLILQLEEILTRTSS